MSPTVLDGSVDLRGFAVALLVLIELALLVLLECVLLVSRPSLLSMVCMGNGACRALQQSTNSCTNCM